MHILSFMYQQRSSGRTPIGELLEIFIYTKILLALEFYIIADEQRLNSIREKREHCENWKSRIQFIIGNIDLVHVYVIYGQFIIIN